MLTGLNVRSRALVAIALLLAGCQSPAPSTVSPASPSPSTGPSTPASPASGTAAASVPLVPLTADWTFGAVTAIDQQLNVPQVIYQTGVDDPTKKAFGTADVHLVTVGGLRYALDPNYWTAAEKLTPGTTVNLYPSLLATIIKNPDGSTTSTRLFDVFPGDKAEPPLTVINLTTPAP